MQRSHNANSLEELESNHFLFNTPDLSIMQIITTKNNRNYDADNITYINLNGGLEKNKALPLLQQYSGNIISCEEKINEGVDYSHLEYSSTNLKNLNNDSLESYIDTNDVSLNRQLIAACEITNRLGFLSGPITIVGQFIKDRGYSFDDFFNEYNHSFTEFNRVSNIFYESQNFSEESQWRFSAYFLSINRASVNTRVKDTLFILSHLYHTNIDRYF